MPAVAASKMARPAPQEERLWGRLPNVYRCSEDGELPIASNAHTACRAAAAAACRCAVANTSPHPHCRHAPTMEQLRRDPRVPFEALPPVEQLTLAGPESHRCAAAAVAATAPDLGARMSVLPC